jgi:hypothetical protein
MLKEFRSIDLFLKYIHDLNDTDQFIYRGQSNSTWPLESRLHRELNHLQINHDQFKNKYDLMLKQFKNELIRFDLVSDTALEKNISITEQIGQHHGLPTRLLDWTYSIYISLFFAFEGISRAQIKNKKVSIWVLNKNKFKNGTILKECLGSLDDPNINKLYTKYQQRDSSIYHITNKAMTSNPRVRKQNGTFLMCNYASEPLDYYIDNNFDHDTLIKITLPSRFQLLVINRLSHMDINAGSLMCSVDGVAIDTAFKYINNSHLI